MKLTKRSWLSITMLVLAVLACSIPSSSTPTSTPIPESSPTEPPTLVPVVPGSTTEPTATIQSIQHLTVPGEPPGERTSFASDQDSFVTSPEKRAPGGDRFTFGRYERPFNGTAMDVYFLQIDIQESSSYQDGTWIYYSITVKGRDSNLALSGKYGVEFDSDIDGRGDWLVLASAPAASDWTTDGVEVWYDSNNDVGGSVSVTSDDQGAGNGYDTKIFDRGTGDDPDLAWVRIPSGQAYTIQFAVKLSLLNSNGVYMAGAWAGNDLLDPALFDLNDHFTQEEAGSSLVEFEFFYPIKAIAEIDNACRVAVGFFASGGEPGLCQSPTSEDGCPFGQSLVCVDTVYGPNCFCSAP